jgi:hypothetical protein
MVELAGAEMLSRTMFVQDATTEVICAYSVAVQAVPSPPAAALAALVTLAADVEETFGGDDAVDFPTAEVVFASDLAEVVAFELVELTNCALSTSEASFVVAVVRTAAAEEVLLPGILSAEVLVGSSPSQESSV